MTERIKRNVEDVGYVAADLTAKPMREVLRERKSLIATIPLKIRESAYRDRAGIIGVLQACLCGYPIRKAPTESEHELWCPSTALLASQLEVLKRSIEMEYAPSNDPADADGDPNADEPASDEASEESETPLAP